MLMEFHMSGTYKGKARHQSCSYLNGKLIIIFAPITVILVTLFMERVKAILLQMTMGYVCSTLPNEMHLKLK
jgi:predicted transcriptional regulator